MLESRVSRDCFCWCTTSTISVSRYISLYRTPLSRNTQYTGRFLGNRNLLLDSIVLLLIGIYDKPDTFATPDQFGLTRHIWVVVQRQCIHIVRSKDVNASPLYDYIRRWVNQLGIQSCTGDAFTSWDLRKQHHLGFKSLISGEYFCWCTKLSISVYSRATAMHSHLEIPGNKITCGLTPGTPEVTFVDVRH